MDDQKAMAMSTLQQILSITSVLSAEAVTSIEQQQSENQIPYSFNLIGDGFCAEIFEKVGTNVVYKKEIGSAGYRRRDL